MIYGQRPTIDCNHNPLQFVFSLLIKRLNTFGHCVFDKDNVEML